MKYLVLAVVLGVAYFMWRAKRVTRVAPAPRLQAPQDMLACAVCAVHIPRSDALMHKGRSYCCAEHQNRHDS